MSSEKNKAIVRGLIEAENTHNPALLDEFLAPDFVNYPDPTQELRGREIYKQGLTQFTKSFPDFHGTIEDIIAEGDKVWIRYKGTGTHKGEYLGLAPTGKKVTLKAFGIYRIVDSKVVELLNFIDKDFFKELGVIE
jgi:predicted ester cyclase